MLFVIISCVHNIHLLFVKNIQFDDLWKSLYEWLEASEDSLQKFVIGVGARTKQDFDELRVSCDVFSCCSLHLHAYQSLRFSRTFRFVAYD